MNLKLAPKQQIAVVGAVLIVVLLLFVGVLVAPQILRLGALGVEEQTAMTELNNSKATYSQLEELKRSSRKTDNELLRLDQKAPDSGAELPALLVQIEDISTKSGIGFMSIKPSNPVQKTNFQEVPMEIQINAYFFSLMDFIYRVEKLQRIINITGIDIKEGKDGLPNIEVVITAKAYVVTPGVAGTKAGAAASSTGAGATTSSAPATGGGGTTSGTTSGTGGASQ
jgi:Tfp pilus assembly protein PilO